MTAVALTQWASAPLPVPAVERPGVYGWALCIDCGHESPRRLPERFPHICTQCLFPPVPHDDDEHHEADATLQSPRKPGLMQRLDDLMPASRSTWFDKPFGPKEQKSRYAHDRHRRPA